MKLRLFTLMLMMFAAAGIRAQGFPDAEKQPKFKEQHGNHKKYARRAHRRHIKRSTAKFELPLPLYQLQSPEFWAYCRKAEAMCAN